MFSNTLDTLERAYFDLHGEGHSLDTGDIRRALFDILCITTETPIGIAIERLSSARTGCVANATLSLVDFRKLCSTYTSDVDYARPSKGVTAARHDRALLRALRDEMTMLELFSAESELRAGVDVD
jgi:hypothetical protein